MKISTESVYQDKSQNRLYISAHPILIMIEDAILLAKAATRGPRGNSNAPEIRNSADSFTDPLFFAVLGAIGMGIILIYIAFKFQLLK